MQFAYLCGLADGSVQMVEDKANLLPLVLNLTMHESEREKFAESMEVLATSDFNSDLFTQMGNDYWNGDNPFVIGHNYGRATFDIVSTVLVITKGAKAVEAAGGIVAYSRKAATRLASMPKKMAAMVKKGALEIRDRALYSVNRNRLLLYMKDGKYFPRWCKSTMKQSGASASALTCAIKERNSMS